jgi:hypothetical protein
MPVEHRPEERARLEASARHALERPELQEPHDAVHYLRPLLRLWRYPAFFAYTSLTVFGPPDDAGMRLLRQVRWDMPHDVARFADPLEGIRQGFNAPPTLSVRDVSLPVELLREHLRAFHQLPIPLVVMGVPVGVDGEQCGLRLDAQVRSVEVQWWGDGPPEWAGIVAAFCRLYDALTAMLPEDGTTPT